MELTSSPHLLREAFQDAAALPFFPLTSAQVWRREGQEMAHSPRRGCTGSGSGSPGWKRGEGAPHRGKGAGPGNKRNKRKEMAKAGGTCVPFSVLNPPSCLNSTSFFDQTLHWLLLPPAEGPRVRGQASPGRVGFPGEAGSPCWLLVPALEEGMSPLFVAPSSPASPLPLPFSSSRSTGRAVQGIKFNRHHPSGRWGETRPWSQVGARPPAHLPYALPSPCLPLPPSAGLHS